MMKVEREVIIKCVEETDETYRNIDGSPIEYIVRCKDCKWYESDGGALMTCALTDMFVDDNCYCWWGERKGGDDE